MPRNAQSEDASEHGESQQGVAYHYHGDVQAQPGRGENGHEVRDVADLTVELAHNFSENKNNPMPEILDDMYHTFACKAAIKANDKNDLKELSSIVRTLLENETIRYCPHGRPVCIELSKYEIEKQFGRA